MIQGYYEPVLKNRSENVHPNLRFGWESSLVAGWSGQRESNPHFVTPIGGRSALREGKTVAYKRKLRQTCVRICVTFSHFSRSGQFNGISRSRCPFAIALL